MFKKIFKGLFYLLLLGFVIIQFFRPAKNKSEGASKNDISTLYAVPLDVQNILKTSCNDCHSNNTRYPWYSKIQPIDWWLDHHVKEGKGELNFSVFATYSPRRQYRKFEEIKEQVDTEEMPLYVYTIPHPEAVLDEPQRELLTQWASAMKDTLEKYHPMDSLVRKK